MSESDILEQIKVLNPRNQRHMTIQRAELIHKLLALRPDVSLNVLGSALGYSDSTLSIYNNLWIRTTSEEKKMIVDGDLCLTDAYAIVRKRVGYKKKWRRVRDE